MIQYNNFIKAMEERIHFKNRASSKILSSRNKLTISILFMCSLWLFLSLFAESAFGQLTTNEYAKLEVIDYPQSFAKLLKKFEGRVVYIDLMASWCKPCIEEFKEAKKLEAYFKEKNIVKLFITIDMKESVESAFQLIQHDSLSGYFVSIPPQNEFNPMSFHQELIDLFFKDENGKIIISIPRYAIVNKKGKFVEKRAARPSDPAELKKQLEKYL